MYSVLFNEILLACFRYTVQVEGYIYHIGICTDAIAGQTGDNQGVVQIKTKEGGQSQSVTLGKYTSSSIMAGSKSFFLKSGSTDGYSSCNLLNHNNNNILL